MHRTPAVILATIAVFALLGLVSSGRSQTTAQIADWYGTVSVDGSTSTVGYTVSAWVNNASVPAAVTAVLGSGYYLIHVPGTAGDLVTFRVYDVNASSTNTTPQNWTLARTFTINSSGGINLNLAISTMANSQVCTSSTSCNSSFCVDGYCCNNACSGSSQGCNVAGFLGTCTSTASANATTTTTTSGGGGTTVQPVTETITIPLLQPEQPVEIILSKAENLGIEKIEIVSTETISNAQVTVTKEIAAPPAAVDNPLPLGSNDILHNYFTITIKAAGQDVSGKVSKAVITFRVDQSWITANGIDKDKVTLLRLSGGSWQWLATQRTTESASSVSYEAESPGFSIFAVTGQKRLPVTAICGNGICEAGETSDTCPADCPAALPVQACSPGKTRCSGSSVERCSADGQTWAFVQGCPYGCSNGACVSPSEKPENKIGVILIIVLVVVILAGFGLTHHHHRRKKKHHFQFVPHEGHHR